MRKPKRIYGKEDRSPCTVTSATVVLYSPAGRRSNHDIMLPDETPTVTVVVIGAPGKIFRLAAFFVKHHYYGRVFVSKGCNPCERVLLGADGLCRGGHLGELCAKSVDSSEANRAG